MEVGSLEHRSPVWVYLSPSQASLHQVVVGAVPGTLVQVEGDECVVSINDDSSIVRVGHDSVIPRYVPASVLDQSRTGRPRSEEASSPGSQQWLASVEDGVLATLPVVTLPSVAAALAHRRARLGKAFVLADDYTGI
ncbi:hypothetical protein KIPB_001071 [Kipferlia bialata]|uniref:Uncharacterized protein n=1 Tax=Kipferlia bialata TaxID=797122 RepID=A0A391NTV7_9EUKA|nr:hypothetical protein KIPB_001071 [Kipferlia bialata]|eukprot:g1071.t1